MGQFARLCAVSKVLYDSELVATRKENEALKLRLFWTSYGAFKLAAAIRVRNQMNEDEPFNCSCRKCVAALRYSHRDGMSSDDELENVNCEFEPLFEAKLKEFGLTFAVVPMDMCIPRPQHECAAGLRYGRETVDMDVHIVVHGCDPRRGDASAPDWMNFTYGAKLFKATTVNDPELKKLEDLFVWLLSVQSSDIRQILMDGLGYY
jgi:hypothetical protein